MGGAPPGISPRSATARTGCRVVRQRPIIRYESKSFVIMSYLEEGLFHDEAGDGATDIPGYDVSPLQGMMGMKGLLLFKMAEAV